MKAKWCFLGFILVLLVAECAADGVEAMNSLVEYIDHISDKLYRLKQSGSPFEAAMLFVREILFKSIEYGTRIITQYFGDKIASLRGQSSEVWKEVTKGKKKSPRAKK